MMTNVPNLRTLMQRISASESTADKLRDAAERLADLAEGDDVIRDEVSRLRNMADEYDADADDMRCTVLENFDIDELLGVAT